MLTEKEIERFKTLEDDILKLRSDIKTQQIVISALLDNLFRKDTAEHSNFYTVITNELNKLPYGSDMQHNCKTDINRWVNKYND